MSTARVWNEPLEDGEPDDMPRPLPEPDALSQAVGGTWYVERYQEEACRETFLGSSLIGPPQRFDRYYVHSSVGALLIDILVGDEPDRQRRAKHIEFKQRWCEQHDRRYLVLTESDLDNPGRVRALLAPGDPDISEPAKRPAKQRGAIQRPKATA